MRKAVIWDLDGTLFDSYDVIVDSIHATFQELNIPISRKEIHRHAIVFSIKSLFAKVVEEYGVSDDQLYLRYSQISQGKHLEIKAMHHAKDVLRLLEEKGVENYVFTHRGRTTNPVLENLNMASFFREVVTSQSGFARKPAPDGILYLVEKYGLEPENTYYVGDRSMDMECAKNAGVSGILFLPERSTDVSGGGERYIVKDLLEILKIV